MAACTKISAAIPLDCGLTQGVNSEAAYLFNIDDFTPAANAGAEIITLTAIGGAKAYTLSGARTSTSYMSEQQDGTFVPQHKHTFTGIALDYTATTKLQVNKLAGARIGAIVKRNDGTYIICGVGATASDTSNVGLFPLITDDPNANGGGLLITATHGENLFDISTPPTFNPTGGIAAWITANVV